LATKDLISFSAFISALFTSSANTSTSAMGGKTFTTSEELSNFTKPYLKKK